MDPSRTLGRGGGPGESCLGWGCRHTREERALGSAPRKSPSPFPVPTAHRSASWRPHPGRACRSRPQDPIAGYTQMALNTGLTCVGPFTCRLFSKTLHHYAIGGWLTLQTEG